MEKKFKPVHIVHLLLFSPIKTGASLPIFGRTRLMKMLFIFQKEIASQFCKDDAADFNFEPYKYGPYSKKVYEAIDFLESREILQINRSRSATLKYGNDADLDAFLGQAEQEETNFSENDVFINEEFSLTEAGKKIMQDRSKWFSWESLSENQRNILINFKTSMCAASLTDILKYVYSKYPIYASESVIKSKLFPFGVPAIK